MPDETWQGDDGEGNGLGIVGSLWRYRLVVLAVTVLAGVARHLASHRVPVRYEAEAALILRDPGSPDVLGGSSGPIDLKAYIAK
jgi:uncharacterized protein involved in exopolysaccharide biosynthesis